MHTQAVPLQSKMKRCTNVSVKKLMRNLALSSQKVLEREGEKNSLHRGILQRGEGESGCRKENRYCEKQKEGKKGKFLNVQC